MQVPRRRCVGVVVIVVVDKDAASDEEDDDADESAYMAAASSVVARNGSVTEEGSRTSCFKNSPATGRQGFDLGSCRRCCRRVGDAGGTYHFCSSWLQRLSHDVSKTANDIDMVFVVAVVTNKIRRLDHRRA